MSTNFDSLSKGHLGTAPRLGSAGTWRSGPKLLLLHGVTRQGKDWQALLPYLDSRWEVVTLDFRGHGHSERADCYLVVDYVADVVRVLESVDATDVTILGHSLGAMVAAAVAAEIPERVSSIVLEDPPFHSMGQAIQGTSWQAQFRGMLRVVHAGGSVEQIAAGLADIDIPMKNGTSRKLGELREPSAIQWSATCLKAIDPGVLQPLVEGQWLDGYNVSSIAKQIRCRTTLLQADPDAGGALTDRDAMEFLVSLQNPTHLRFPGCNHQLHATIPEQVAAATNSVLGAVL
ncbi:MAG: alpha/beta fold hydrolase [Pirellula sp.]